MTLTIPAFAVSGSAALNKLTRRGFGAAALAAGLALTAGSAQALPTRQVTIQAYQVCDDMGNNCAQTSFFDDFTTKIWAQADIVVNFLGLQQVNSTARLNETNFSDLGPNADSSIINLWFLNDLSDCGGNFGFGSLYGCGTSGGWFAMTKAVFDYSAVGRVDTLSHELGHVLGLGHDDFGAGNADNLMTSGGSRSIAQVLGDVAPDGAAFEKLTTEQIAQARSSRYTADGTPIPEPGSLALAGLALFGLAVLRRKHAG